MDPKRVILRMRDSDYPDLTFDEVKQTVEAFLTFSPGHSAEELAQGRHIYHVQPPNPDIPQRNPRCHIIIDMEVREYPESEALGEGFPHEIYRVVRCDDKINIIPFNNTKEHDNFVYKMRYFTDDFYPWGSQKRRTQVSSETNNMQL